jgi:hypothetical protein
VPYDELMKTVTTLLLLWSASTFAAQDNYHLVFSKVHADARFIEGPMVNGMSAAVLEFKDPATQTTVDPAAQITVGLWMVSMGHGSTPTRVSRAAGGVYEVREMNFFMGGEWRVDVTLQFQDGRQETQSFTINLGEDGGGHSHHH